MAIDDNTTYGLTGAQIKELPGKIQGAVDEVVLSGAGAPTTSTTGTVGQLYEDTTNGKLYICTAVSGSTYTWSEVGAGGGGGSSIITLTSADYNFPAASPDGINPLLLNPGIYKATNGLYAYISRDAARNPVRSMIYGDVYLMVDIDPQASRRALVFYPAGVELTDSIGEEMIRGISGSVTKFNTAHSVLTSQNVKNNLTSTDTIYPLSANQGKVLNDKITPSSGSGAPTTSTAGELGKIYIDTSTNEAYMCTAVSGSTYTWKQITA